MTLVTRSETVSSETDVWNYQTHKNGAVIVGLSWSISVGPSKNQQIVSVLSRNGIVSVLACVSVDTRSLKWYMTSVDDHGAMCVTEV